MGCECAGGKGGKAMTRKWYASTLVFGDGLA
jgi:hypothetical protein